MRKFFPRVAFLTVLLVIFGGVLLLFLSQLRPFRPGNMIFPVQYLAERQRAALTFSSVGRAYYELALLERRIDDLILEKETPHTASALHYLDLALTDASERVARATIATPESQLDLHTRLLLMLQYLQATLLTMENLSQENPEIFQTVQAKVDTLAFLLASSPAGANNSESPAGAESLPSSKENDPAISPTPSDTLLDPLGVPFPPGSEGAEHLFYPLLGQHAVIECAACHPNEQYAGTATACIACHQAVLPVNHFVGDCAICHTPVSWQEATFDHALYGANDCLSCHSSDAPANHYAGQCSNCHTTTNWTDVSFDHTGQTDCATCHGDEAPANHYAGQCSNCHTTTNWADVSFDHTGQTDCAACHSDETPSNHYAGQCSSCHNTRNWADATFDHSGQTDCTSCHNPPANHYDGQCSSCHSTNNWNFDHSGNADCLSCHADDEPNEDDHPHGEQCSNCHNTSDWDDADDDGGGGDDD
ncbi:MAG: hypothetical protein HUU38_05770 [Anaerolineales bacterium]|nr:hypothetical protein [Anaerolineales bacterium]